MLSKRTKGFLWRVWTVSPIFIGLFCFWILYRNYDPDNINASWLNFRTWGIMIYAPVNEFALLHMLLVSNVVIVAFGTCVYISEIRRGLNTTSVKGGMFRLIAALLIAFVAIGLCFLWIMVYSETSRLASLNVDSKMFADALVGQSDLFVIVIFSAFGVADWLLMTGYSKDGLLCETLENKEECKARREFAHNALVLVDIPVVLGSVVLWVFARSLFSDPRFTGLGPEAATHLAQAGVGMGGGQSLSKAMSNTFAGGFSLGSIVCQLAYSQFVFTILNFRVTEAASAAKGEV